MFSGFTLKTGYARLKPPPVFTTCLHLFVIALIGLISYSNTFQAPFVFDDIDQVQNNLMIRDLANFPAALKGHNFGSGGYMYTPGRLIGYLSFALDYHLGGADVTRYHITNLFIHITNALLVYFLVVLTFRTPHFAAWSKGQRAEGKAQSALSDQRSGGQPQGDCPYSIYDSRSFIAIFAALLFVSHPVQTQAVTYIVQRFASLATLFYLLSLVMYIKGRLKSQGAESMAHRAGIWRLVRGPMPYALCSLLVAVLAMKTKEIAFTLPLVIILYESVFFTAPLKKKLLFILPVALTLLIVPLSVMHSDKPLGEILSDVSEKTKVQTQMSRQDYLLTEMRVITTYIRLIFMPVNQNLDYDYPIYISLSDPAVFLSFVFLSALFGAAVYMMYKSQKAKGREQRAEHERLAVDPMPSAPGAMRLVAFGILWFFITLSVESSIIPIVDVIFEHRVYLPSVGLFTAITAGMFFAAARMKKEKGVALILLLITLALSAATYARNNIWKDSAGLWEDVVRKSPNKARPHNILGEVYGQRGRLDEAIREYQAALRLNFEDAKTYNNLGVIYERQHRLDKAMREYQAAVRLNPDYVEAHYNLGIVHYKQGRLDDAMREYQAAVRLNPDYAKAHNNLGTVYEEQGLLDEARKEYQTALRLNPDYTIAYHNLEALNKKMKSKGL